MVGVRVFYAAVTIVRSRSSVDLLVVAGRFTELNQYLVT